MLGSLQHGSSRLHEAPEDVVRMDEATRRKLEDLGLISRRDSTPAERRADALWAASTVILIFVAVTVTDAELAISVIIAVAVGMLVALVRARIAMVRRNRDGS